MNSKTFILLSVGIFCFSLSVYAQQTYIVQGTVLDKLTNKPVQNAQVWLYGIQAGDLTDSLGNYEFEAFKSYSNTRMYVRYCGDEIAKSKLISFGADSLIQTDFSINAHQSDCPSPSNIPWKVNPSESEVYEGHIFLGMHGVFFTTCSENSYSPVWPAGFIKKEPWKEIWPDNSQYGDSLFIRIKGRLDPLSKNVYPFQNLYVGEIILIDTAKTHNCDLN